MPPHPELKIPESTLRILSSGVIGNFMVMMGQIHESAPAGKSVGTTRRNGADPSPEMPPYAPVNPDAQR